MMKKLFVGVVLALTLILGIGTVARAQSSDYELDGFVVASGSTLSGGAYTVDDAAGQSDVGTLHGGDYELGGGFFGGGVISDGARGRVYLPFMRR